MHLLVSNFDLSVCVPLHPCRLSTALQLESDMVDALERKDYTRGTDVYNTIKDIIGELATHKDTFR